MSRQAPFTVLTDQIGDELARLIKDTIYGSTLRVCQFGGIERLASAPELAKILPAVFIEPFPKTLWQPETGLDINGTQSDVKESFRIACFFAVSSSDNPLRLAIDVAKNALDGLRVDATLSRIADTVRPNMIWWSGIESIDWSPEEELFLTDTAQPAKVVVLEWAVRWYNR